MRKDDSKLIRTVSLIVILGSFCLIGTAKLAAKQLVQNARIKREAELHRENHTQICKHPTINEFPDDFLSFEKVKYPGLIVHFLIGCYFLIGISIVCDEFFVESLSLISKNLNLKEDVAGATFMAAGTSAPELFTSIIGVLIADSDIGTGTIVGSAIFNVLFIIGICALAAKSVLHIDFYPLTRDCLYYVLSVLALMIVLYDGEINSLESIFLLVLYAFYIVIMYFNEKIEKWAKSKVSRANESKQEENSISKERTAKVKFVLPSEGNTNVVFEISESAIDVVSEQQEHQLQEQQPQEQQQQEQQQQEEQLQELSQPKDPQCLEPKSDKCNEEEEKSEFFNPFQIPEDSFISKVYWLVSLPLNVMFYFTIPDCRRKRFEKFPFYFITFIIATIYIAIFTYGLVWMVVIISYRVNIPDTVAGLTVLAAGTSLPEVVSSIIITRQGKGEMAMSNSIGSNVFDILICLGFPWFLQSTVIKPFTVIKVYSGGIFYSVSILLCSIIILIGCFVVSKWKMDKKFGVIMFVIWIIVTLITCLFEYDVFGKFSVPYC